MSDAWQEHALRLRGVLQQLGVTVHACAPGEPDDCGASWASHCTSYLAALKAKAEDSLRHMYHGDPDGDALAAELYQFWDAQFRAKPCGHQMCTS